jgi:hypothetical protein
MEWPCRRRLGTVVGMGFSWGLLLLGCMPYVQGFSPTGTRPAVWCTSRHRSLAHRRLAWSALQPPSAVTLSCGVNGLL